jgi:hypothetical protein
LPHFVHFLCHRGAFSFTIFSQIRHSWGFLIYGETLITKKITNEQYASETTHIEDEALFNQFVVAKALKIRDMGGKYANKTLRKYSKGKITDEALKKLIYDSSEASSNPKSKRKSFDVYLEQGKNIQKFFDKINNSKPDPDEKIPDHN